MATFIFKVNRQQVDFDNLANSPMKESFERLRTTMSDQLQSLHCEVHHQEPRVFLQSDGKRVNLAGFIACCEQFSSIVKDRINLLEGYTGSDVLLTTKTIVR